MSGASVKNVKFSFPSGGEHWPIPGRSEDNPLRGEFRVEGDEEALATLGSEFGAIDAWGRVPDPRLKRARCFVEGGGFGYRTGYVVLPEFLTEEDFKP